MARGIMKVTMLVNTAYQGARHVGEVVEVPTDFAIRWANNGIAKFAEDMPIEEEEVIEETDVGEEDEPAEEEAVALESLTAKQLYAMCIDQGFEVEPKQAKATYLALLNPTTEQEA